MRATIFILPRMNSRSRTLHLALASSIAVAFIVCSYLFSGPFSFRPSTVDAATAETLLKAYATKDSDSDGLPDWQETLYGTDPANPESVQAGIKDGEAVAQGLVKPKFESEAQKPTSASSIPGTLPSDDSVTAQFSQEFFKSYIDAGGQTMTASEQQALLTKLMSSFVTRAEKVVVSPYTALSIHPDKNVTLLGYAQSVEAIIIANDSPKGSESPLDLMDAYINAGDSSAGTKLSALAKQYERVSAALLALRVPPQLSASHLLLLQSFDSLARSTRLIANYQKDPIAVLGAVSMYQPASTGVVTALTDIATSILAQGEPGQGTPGFIIVNFARSTQAQ